VRLKRYFGKLSNREGIEEQINDRISFSKFCGISMGAKAPDSTVLCRFRSVLNKNNTFKTLLTMINKRLEEGNLIVVTGVIVDASVTTTLRKPRGKKEYVSSFTTLLI
jgi:transposase, IS5 family